MTNKFIFNLLLFTFLFYSNFIFSQVKNEKVSIGLGLGLISTSKIFPNPNSSNIIERNRAFELENILSPNLELRYHFNEEVSVGLSTEYASTMKTGNYVIALAGNQIVELKSEDGFDFLPIELSVYQTLPFSTNQFSFLIGGGLGYYKAWHKRNFGDTKISTLESSGVFGIQVSASVEYSFYDNLNFYFLTKYRAPEIKVKSKYDKTSINYQGRVITIIEDTFNSKISVNGVVLMLGLKYNFDFGSNMN